MRRKKKKTSKSYEEMSAQNDIIQKSGVVHYAAQLTLGHGKSTANEPNISVTFIVPRFFFFFLGMFSLLFREPQMINMKKEIKNYYIYFSIVPKSSSSNQTPSSIKKPHTHFCKTPFLAVCWR